MYSNRIRYCVASPLFSSSLPETVVKLKPKNTANKKNITKEDFVFILRMATNNPSKGDMIKQNTLARTSDDCSWLHLFTPPKETIFISSNNYTPHSMKTTPCIYRIVYY